MKVMQRSKWAARERLMTVGLAGRIHKPDQWRILVAKRTVVELLDDVDGTVAEATVSFGVDGVQYEIDLSAANAAKLRKDLAKWTDKARRVPGARRASGRRTGAGSSYKSSDVREWANANGYKVALRGRIPAEVQQAYDAAH